MLTSTINWNKLSQIEELEEYFQEDFLSFQHLIEQFIRQMEQFTPEELNKFALLRVLEVTNGCTQWAFRRGEQCSLPLSQTRQCMKMVMGFIKRQTMEFPSQGSYVFNAHSEDFLNKNRQLYCDAFKNNIKEAKRTYYALSTAQFIAYGRSRLLEAMALVKQDYESLFTPYFIERGRNYIAPYLKCI
ncbi:conserved hypothetical protein [Gloeothece citriformis PCC 7424]|uniref:Uncharacterized protein n=1 Tax=Gloeothece citriformis (strain PCC 7424) TaxID=65393 RepID=B7KE27_GLOC7|nr:hypothetical protein [Gloeothece citriformis]ACK71725.1 conserved hypothetical protein [Gloeothece citriformis PCC 7424]